MTEPTIPFGAKRIFGRTQKGDRRYDPATGKFVKVKKEYPIATEFEVFIRRCDVTQTMIPGAGAEVEEFEP